MAARRNWIVGFDADDTLWHNERFFQMTQERFAALLADHVAPDHLADRLLEAERRNLGHYGYGIKGFMLSMIETATEVCDADLPSDLIREILAAGQEMLRHPIELLPGARAAVEDVARTAKVVLITKGDLLDQERKLAQSGLGDLFDQVEIVSEKTPQIYTRVFSGAPRAVMVGNSLRSDVIPALEAGAFGVHVPHDLTWDLEQDEPPVGHPRFREIETLAALPALLSGLS